MGHRPAQEDAVFTVIEALARPAQVLRTWLTAVKTVRENYLAHSLDTCEAKKSSSFPLPFLPQGGCKEGL
jgi:hypothetical protein